MAHDHSIAQVKYVGDVTRKHLQAHGITTLPQLAALSENALAAIPGIGVHTAARILVSAKALLAQPLSGGTPADPTEVNTDSQPGMAVQDMAALTLPHSQPVAVAVPVAPAPVIWKEEPSPLTDIPVRDAKVVEKSLKKQHKAEKKARKAAKKAARKAVKEAEKQIKKERKAEKKARKKASKQAKKQKKQAKASQPL